MVHEVKVYSPSRYSLYYDYARLNVAQFMLREQPTVHRTVILRTMRRSNVTRFRLLQGATALPQSYLLEKVSPNQLYHLLARQEPIIKWTTPIIRISQQRWVPLFGAPSPLHAAPNHWFPWSQLKNKRVEVSADRCSEKLWPVHTALHARYQWHSPFNGKNRFLGTKESSARDPRIHILLLAVVWRNVNLPLDQYFIYCIIQWLILMAFYFNVFVKYYIN